MKRKYPLTASAALVALLAAASWSAPAAAQGGSYCTLVKDQAAGKACFAARQQYENGEYRAALVTMRKAMAAAPHESVLRAMAAYIMMAMGDTGSAEHELRQARTDGAASHVVLSALLPLMISRHEETALLSEFPEPPAGAKGEEAADILSGRARALQALDRLPEAASSMDRALALRRDGAGLVLRADIAWAQKDTVLAAKLVDEALQRDPKNGPAALAKLKQVQATGDSAKTLAFTQKMLDQFPDAIEFRRARIEIFINAGQDAQAKAEVRALQAKFPNSNTARYYTALLMARAKDKKGAWEMIQAVPASFVKQNPTFAMPMAQLAVDNGHVDLGMAILGNAISADPNLVDARLQLARLRLEQNSPQGALSVLSPVKDSTDPKVQKLISDIRAKIAKDRAF